MTNPQTNDNTLYPNLYALVQNDLPQPLALLLFTQRLAALKWQDLSAYQQMVTLALFFETFGMQLASGVALLPAMKNVSTLLPSRQAAEFLQVRREIKEGAPLLALPVERLDYIPRYAKEIAGLGQMKGCLDSALHEAAILFEQELEYRLQGA